MTADALIDPTSPSVKGPTMKFVHPGGSQPLEGFTIARGLGRGGFGEVYLAATQAGKEVALKLIQRSLETELRGVQTCINLKHPNLVEIYDVREDRAGDAWIVMEYVAGERMEDVLERSPGGLSEAETRAWVEGAMEGLEYLHERGVVHRDVKPGNLFREDGRVKLGDYGLSKFLTASRRSGHTESIGTVHYMAPEVSRGKYGREIDLYALGVILYECLCGRRPFDGESMAEILMKHLASAPDLTAIPAAYRPVVAALLEKDPARRLGSVQALRRMLPAYPALGGEATLEPSLTAHAAAPPRETPAASATAASATGASATGAAGAGERPDLFTAWPRPAGGARGGWNAPTPPVRSRGFQTTLPSDPGREAPPQAAAPSAGEGRGEAQAAAGPAPRFGDWVPPRRGSSAASSRRAPFGGRPQEPLAAWAASAWAGLEEQPGKKGALVVLLIVLGLMLAPLVWVSFWCYLVYRIAWEVLHSVLDHGTNHGAEENAPPPPRELPERAAATPPPVAALRPLPVLRQTPRPRPLFVLEDGAWPSGPFPAKGWGRAWEEAAGSALAALVYVAIGAAGWAAFSARAGAGALEQATLVGAVAAVAAWAALAAGKLCERNAPGGWSRLLFAAVGGAVGIVAGVLSQWVSGAATRGADVERIAALGVVFAIVFTLGRWHRLTHPLRPSRWRVGPPIFSGLYALCIDAVTGLEAGWFAGSVFLAALAVQWAAPHQRDAWVGWMRRREAALDALAAERNGRGPNAAGGANVETPVQIASPPCELPAERVRTAWPKRFGFGQLVVVGVLAALLGGALLLLAA